MSKIINSAVILLLSAGCAKSQNPVKQYESVPAVTPYEQEERIQKFATCLVTIETEPSMIVSDGETVKQKVYVRGLANPSKQSLTLEAAPEGLQLSKGQQTASGQEFTLSLTGSDALIPNGENYAKFNVTLIPSVKNQGLDCSEKMSVIVTRSKQTPVIKKINAPSTVDLSKEQDRSVTVNFTAPGTKDINSLIIIKKFDTSASSKENPIYDISPAIRQIGNIESAGGSNYKAKFELDPEIVKFILADSLPKKFNKPEIEMLFSVLVFNKETNKVSPEENKVIRIKLEVEPK